MDWFQEKMNWRGSGCNPVKKHTVSLKLFNLTIATLKKKKKGGEKHINTLKMQQIKKVKSGNITELYIYENPIYYDYQKFSNIHQGSRIKPDDWQGKEDFSLQRARQKIRRLIWANRTRHMKFLTLTYRTNMQDLKTFYNDFKIMQQNLKYQNIKLRYLYVLEYQERGAIHCHMVVFNSEYIPANIIEKAWGKGFIKINQIKDIKNLGAYVCKYLTKESMAEYNSKSFHTSRGLNQPTEEKISPEDTYDTLQGIEAENSLIYESEFPIQINDIITNYVKYRQYRLKKE